MPVALFQLTFRLGRIMALRLAAAVEVATKNAFGDDKKIQLN